MSKPVVLLDCDEVLADFVGGVCSLATSLFGRKLEPHTVTEWDFCKALGLDKHETSMIKRRLAWSAYLWPTLRPIPGVQSAVARLREVSEVYIVSTPWDSCTTWLPERQTWLKEHFELPPERLIPTSQKHLISGDIFVDDKPEAVAAWDEHQGYWQDNQKRTRAILWDRAHNRHVAGGYDLRATSWDQVFACL